MGTCRGWCNRRAYGVLVLLVGVGGVAALWGQREKRMTAPFYRSTPEQAEATATPPVAIRDAGPLTAGPAEVTGLSGLRPYGNPERNSRAARRVSTDPWRLRWQADLPPGFHALFALAGPDRVLVIGTESWLLLDDRGVPLREHVRGEGEVVLDPPHGLFYSADENGYLAAYHLRDGAQAFLLSVHSGDRFRRAFVMREGQRMWVVSTEKKAPGRPLYEEYQSAVEVQELGEPPELSETGRIKNARRVSRLRRRTNRLLTAAHGRTLVFAADDRLHWADGDLKLEAEVTGEFQPDELSLDEAGRAYILVRTAEGRALWVVTREGQRLLRYVLPPGFVPLAPPAIGRDHTVYLVGRDKLLAVNPATGRVQWEHTPSGPVSGILVTADHVLATLGAEVVAFDRDGKRTRLFAVEGDTLTTPPVLTAAGHLVVAGQRRVYCVQP